jgi:alpha-glucosidase
MRFAQYKRAVACGVALVLPSALDTAARADSLDVTVGRTVVRITAIAPTVFRVSVNAGGGPALPRDTLFVDPVVARGDVGRPARTAAGHLQLKADAGTLDVDPVAGTLALLDARGTVLVPPAPVAAMTMSKPRAATAAEPAVPAHPVLDLRIGWPAGRPFAVYGCGNGEGGVLVQHRVDTRVRNRVSVEPCYWSPAGYATLVVGADDDAPATCDGKVDHAAVTWAVPGTSADLYLTVAPTLAEGTRGLLRLTGRPPVPPRWTFGYLQSRWGWVDKAYIDDALHQFQVRRLPVDAFIFDFEWYTQTPDYQVKPEGVANFSDFGFNPKLFPDPAAQIRQMHDAGVHVVGIRKPRLGDSATLVMARQNQWDFSGQSGTDARALRFADADARAWYADRIGPLLRDGIDGWWNDEGEFSFTNFYRWNQAERTALAAVRPDARFWTINRAYSPGMARLGATAWTGDIRASWHDLEQTPASLLNWGLAGMPFAGCDIGGYRGPDTPELLVRWMEAGALFPIMRAHSQRTVTPRFPWLYGPDAESAIRKALDLRYRLVPVLYSLAHQTHETGDPLMRPLAMQYPADPAVADMTSEWMVGSDLLATPALDEGGRQAIYLPDDQWYDFSTGRRVSAGSQPEQVTPLDAVPLYVRGGSILTLAAAGAQHTRELAGKPLDLHVYPGRDAAFTLVEDDGDTTAYETAGAVRRTAFRWDDGRRVLSWSQTGPYDGPDRFRSVRVTIHDGKDRPPVELALAAAGQVLASN